MIVGNCRTSRALIRDALVLAWALTMELCTQMYELRGPVLCCCSYSSALRVVVVVTRGFVTWHRCEPEPPG